MEDLTSGGAGSAFVITCAAGWEQQARAEIRQALSGGEPPIGCEFGSLILKGNLLLRCEAPEKAVLALLAEADTRAFASATPVQFRVSLPPGAQASSPVVEAALATRRLKSGDTFLIRVNRRGRHEWQSRELEREVALALEKATGAVGEYEKPTTWLVSAQVYQDLAFVGVFRLEATLRKQPSLQRKYAPGERPVSRAEWKLKEAFQAFGIELPRGARALDLGAAPGGWTRVLAGMGFQVAAVDPARLDREVAALPGVTHFACRAEQMAEHPDLEAAFDLLTNDMNLEPAESAQLMVRLARLLKPGALAIMTVKLMTPALRRYRKQVEEILAPEYEDLRFRRLPHNAKEITVVMRRRSGGDRTQDEADESPGWQEQAPAQRQDEADESATNG